MDLFTLKHIPEGDEIIEFEVNGIEGDYRDFGSSIVIYDELDGHPEAYFEPNDIPNPKVLEKYSITEEEYSAVVFQINTFWGLELLYGEIL